MSVYRKAQDREHLTRYLLSELSQDNTVYTKDDLISYKWYTIYINNNQYYNIDSTGINNALLEICSNDTIDFDSIYPRTSIDEVVITEEEYLIETVK